MSGKVAIHVRDFRPLHKHTPVGFASIYILALRLTVREVAVHQHQNGGRRAQLPARPQVKKGELVKDHTGKVQSAAVMDFDNSAVRSAFSLAVVNALLERFPNAFDAHAREPAA